jgi:lipoprotein-releasing system ATP-binding protein
MIEVENITKSYQAAGGAVPVLVGLDFQVVRGEAVAVTGPSGCGKTTLLNLLGAMDRPDSGEIRIGGTVVTSFTDEEAARFRNRSLGFVFQHHHLLPQLGVLENVLVPRLAGGWEEPVAATEARARELLERVGLSHRLNHHPWQLSGGERLRAAVARALVNRPELVLADEPTGLLDEESSAKVADLLMELNRERGMTLIVVTHDTALARRIGRTFALTHGRLGEVAA